MRVRPLVSFGLVVSSIAACGGATTADPVDAAIPDASSAPDSGSAGAPSEGSEDAAAPAARVIVAMNGGAAPGCVTVPPMTLGTFGDPAAGAPAVPVTDGERLQGKPVAVTCRVTSLADGFAIDAAVTVEGGARLTLAAKTDLKGSSSNAAVSLAEERSWSSPSCTLDVSALAPQGGVGPGRYWGLVTCMGAANDLGATCDLFGQIRLENCAP